MIKDAILKAIGELSQKGVNQVSSSQLNQIKASPASIKRYLNDLVTSGHLTRTGKARATRYQLTKAYRDPQISDQPTNEPWSVKLAFPMSPESWKLVTALEQPLASRPPVTYQRKFVDQYLPNETWFLAKPLAETLFKEGRMVGQQPAGTYARKVLEQLLIDLSWSSSRLEGNQHTLLETEELFKRGTEGTDADAIMLLNHKRAIEFLVDAVPEYGLTSSLIRNLHSLLMQDLLSDPRGLGEIRTKIVNISDTVYVPSQVPQLLEEMLNGIIHLAKQIKNPVEAAFYLWVNIAYLQPFEDGNKRTSRLAANIPLIMYNCAPLSFLDVNEQDYAFSMMGIYELRDLSLAKDLFTWTYRHSIQKYTVLLESIGVPNPLRLKYRGQISSAIQAVVREGQMLEEALGDLSIPHHDRSNLISILREELMTLTIHNCARYRLTMTMVDHWIKNGRPL